MFMFKIALVSAVLAGLAGIAVCAPNEAKRSIAPLPEGSADGVYIAYINEDGSTRWEFQGPHNTSLVAEFARRGPPSAESALVKRSGVHCGGSCVNAEDANTAMHYFGNLCGNGYVWSGRAIATAYGSAVAFGCNYGSSQRCTSSDVWYDFAQINSVCGFTHNGCAGAGWYRHDGKNPSSYGRTSSGSGYC